jgi:osmotically-inducible protein OsmY
MLAILSCRWDRSGRKRNMQRKSLLLGVVVFVGLGLAGCSESGVNGNSTANANASPASPRVELPAATTTPTPKYSEEDAKAERARAKQNKETVGDTLEDAWIHTKIVTKLIGDAKTPERNINVDVVNNEVTLRGTVDTAEAKAEAERVAKDTDGVKKVTNQLKVAPGSTKPANANKSGNTNKPK